MPHKEVVKARNMHTEQLSFLLGGTLPAVWFIILMALFTYKYHTAPVVPWLTVILCLNVVFVSARPVIEPTRRWTRWDWFPMFAGIVSVGMGVMLGLPNSTVMEPWVHATHLKEHTDVLPTWDPVLASDAGILNFAEGSAVDIDASAGYLAWPHTYCAAPIVDNTSDAGQPLGFFVVGLDCCDRRGGFSCGEVNDPDARSGVRIRSHALTSFFAWRGSGDVYSRAARMAAAANGREVKDPVVIVLWTKDPDSLARSYWWTATGIFLASMVTAALCGFGNCYVMWEANKGK
jgi:hypothetical protein